MKILSQDKKVFGDFKIIEANWNHSIYARNNDDHGCYTVIGIYDENVDEVVMKDIVEFSKTHNEQDVYKMPSNEEAMEQLKSNNGIG